MVESSFRRLFRSTTTFDLVDLVSVSVTGSIGKLGGKLQKRFHTVTTASSLHILLHLVEAHRAASHLRQSSIPLCVLPVSTVRESSADAVLAGTSGKGVAAFAECIL